MVIRSGATLPGLPWLCHLKLHGLHELLNLKLQFSHCKMELIVFFSLYRAVVRTKCIDIPKLLENSLMPNKCRLLLFEPLIHIRTLFTVLWESSYSCILWLQMHLSSCFLCKAGYEDERVLAPALVEPAVYWVQQAGVQKLSLNVIVCIKIHTAFHENHVREYSTALGNRCRQRRGNEKLVLERRNEHRVLCDQRKEEKNR